MWFPSCCTVSSFLDVGLKGPIPSVEVVDLSAPVVHSLAQLWQPIIAQDHIAKQGPTAPTLFKQTTLDKVDADDLVSTAAKIRKGGAASLEIGSFLLGNEAVEAIRKQIDLTTFFPDQKIDLKVRNLVIDTPDSQDGRCIDNGDSSPLRLGWVEVVLNSEYTGGELQVVCDGQTTDMKTDPYNWAAVLGDASSAVSLVTSGARVSLTFDIMAIPTPADVMFQGGTFSFMHTNLVSDMIDSVLFVPEMVSIAEQLRPELVGQDNLTIDACILNTHTLEALVQQVDAREWFGKTRVIFQAKYLTIQRSERATHTSCDDSGGQGIREGYLGTLVMVLHNGYTSARAHLSRGEQHSVTSLYRQMWCVFRADTTVTFERINAYGAQNRAPIVAMHYDIYSALPSIDPHDPLPDYSSGIETPSFLTRSVVPETVRAEVVSVLQAELTNSDAVIITLQHLFPEGPTDSLWNTYPASLQGGDRVLYDILTGTNTNDKCWGELYSVKLVEVTVRCAYDNHLMNDVIVPEECTFVPIIDPLMKWTRCSSGPANVKMIVATRLTYRHRVDPESRTLSRVYRVFSLYVSKKMYTV